MSSFRVAVLLSGEGSNLQALIDSVHREGAVEIVCVGSNKREAREGPSLTPEQVFDKVSPAVYMVLAGDGMGSAVAISEHELLTNCHVVKDLTQVTLTREWPEGWSGHRGRIDGQLLDIREYQEQVGFYFRDSLRQLTFPSPWLRQAPTRYERSEADGLDRAVRSFESHRESFVRELVHFHECITEGVECRTPPEQARVDIELLTQMFLAAAT